MPISIITWVHVPAGSQLEVSIEPDEGGFVSGGDIFMEDKGLVPIKQWNDVDLRPGPAVEPLKAGVDYTVDIRAASAARDVVEGTLTAVLRDQATGASLAEEERPFRISPRSHHLVRIFVDADPVPASEAIAAAPGAMRARTAARSAGRKKRGK